MSSGIRRIAAKKSPFQLQILKLYADFVRLAKNRPGLLEKVIGNHNKITSIYELI